MSNLIPFSYQNKQVRTVVNNGEPWFVAKDVCEILEIEKYRDAASRLSESQRGSVIVDTLGGPQEMTAINEAGLYKLIFTSRKPEAEKFTDWVASEVIPSIRKTGQYIAKPASPLEALRYTVEALEQQALRMDKLESTQQAIKDAVISEPDNWREDMRHKLNKIAKAIGDNKFREVRSESYKLLEQRAGVNLERRLDNLKLRLMKEGVAKSNIDKSGKIDVIDQDKKLREIYGKIVSEYLIRYCA
ncbi:MAG TPA: Bro-N domain-containing protein [Candidatus Nitrosocosmicus sp.]|nr:Bro-N domain-containing protein [Candidatus Nitrosocosmicus sp.]